MDSSGSIRCDLVACNNSMIWIFMFSTRYSGCKIIAECRYLFGSALNRPSSPRDRIKFTHIIERVRNCSFSLALPERMTGPLCADNVCCTLLMSGASNGRVRSMTAYELQVTVEPGRSLKVGLWTQWTRGREFRMLRSWGGIDEQFLQIEVALGSNSAIGWVGL